LIQALHHLLKNAIHYTLHGGILVCTGLSAKQEQVFLSVQDTGMGIDSVDMPHLFKRFYRGQKVGQLNIPGTGLGLTICQEIVQQHRGTIEVESQLNMGSTFTIWLPVYRSSELETAESTPAAK
jgi:signal transduction histidine kinase